MNLSVKKLVFDERINLGFEILSLNGSDIRSKEYLKVPHRAAFYLIIWFQKGNPLHIVDFNPVSIKTDSFLFVRKNAVQFFDQTSEFISRTILFTEDFFCSKGNDHQLLQASSLFNNFSSSEDYINILSTPVMKILWELMEHEATRQGDSQHAALLQKYLSSFLLLAERENQKSGYEPIPPGPQAELTIAFIDQLEHNFKKEKAVSYYSDKLSVSDKMLTNALQSITGKAPKQLVNERVMLEARRLLIHNGQSAKMIALSLGFDEPTNFNKYFKKHSGKTPTEFRKYYNESRMRANVSS